MACLNVSLQAILHVCYVSIYMHSCRCWLFLQLQFEFTIYMHYRQQCWPISPSYVHRLILISHTLCIQETDKTTETAVEQFTHTGYAEFTTLQEDIADRETTTVSAVHTIV